VPRELEIRRCPALFLGAGEGCPASYSAGARGGCAAGESLLVLHSPYPHLSSSDLQPANSEIVFKDDGRTSLANSRLQSK
jgi:hypothetical protein